MNEHEAAFVTSFVAKEKQERYSFLLESGDKKRRKQCLRRLNHWYDYNPKYAFWLERNPRSTARYPEIAALLRQKGSPATVYLISEEPELDGKSLPLLEAIRKTAEFGWGTILSCIPGILAYYYGEECERHAILEHLPGT